jgi:DinB family protein
MGQIGQIIQAGTTRVFGLSEALTSGIDAKQFARKPNFDDRCIDCSHPAFNFGHLAIYPKMVLTLCGADEAVIKEVTAPEAWEALFTHGSECHDDPDGSIYPAKDELVEAYLSWNRKAVEVVAELSDDTFAKPNPAGGTFTEMLPTLGIMANFMFNDHTMFHLGQVSTWRRTMGLGSAM